MPTSASPVALFIFKGDLGGALGQPGPALSCDLSGDEAIWWFPSSSNAGHP
jgi:hypothetical protein